MEVIVVGVCVDAPRRYTVKATGEVREEFGVVVRDGSRSQVWQAPVSTLKGPVPSVGQAVLVFADYVVSPKFRFAAQVHSVACIVSDTGQAYANIAAGQSVVDVGGKAHA